ncbi:transcriptional regulator [Deltaproteobacteria bacterium]|nr:transcriptional regulator [Deltaproteobacteria bacterium]
MRDAPASPDSGSAADYLMDDVDRKIVSLIQSGFPLAPRPYALIGEYAGIGELAALERVRALKKREIVRRIGANFDSGKIGFFSTLCAAKVPPEKLDEFMRAVNALKGVTHNYQRNHAYNVWFTYIGPSLDAVAADLAILAQKTGIAILNLPAKRLYKIHVDFPVEEA